MSLAAGARRWCLVCLWAGALLAQAPAPTPAPNNESKPAAETAVTVAENAPLTSAEDTQAAASLRNENIYITRIDNNALRDALVRLGASLTLVLDPGVKANYYAAEFGQTPAEFPFLAANPLSGWHGEMFAAHQNSVFNSRTFFQAGPVEPSRSNHYGFRAGGPTAAGHALSVEVEQRKVRGMVNGNVLVPAADERQPRAADPAVRALIARWLRAYPAQTPNRTEIDPRALNTNSPQAINDDRLLGRWDAGVRGSRRLAMQYQYHNQYVQSFQLVAGQNPDTTLAAQQARITMAQPFRGAGAFTAGVAFDRLRSVLVPEPNAVGPYVRVARSLENLGPRSTVPLRRVGNNFHAATQLAWVSGEHRLTAGAEFTRNQLNGSETNNHRGEFNFPNNFDRSAIENFLYGTPTTYEFSLGDPARGFRNAVLQAYLGDEWRAGARWQLALGLRYGLETAPHEVNDRTVVPYGCDCNNFSPRFGFVFDGGAVGLVRGAYTLSYGQIIPASYQQTRFNPPGIINIQLVNPDLLNPLGGLELAALGPQPRSGLFQLAPNLRDPYSHQYSLSWEKRLPAAAVLRLGYVGSRTFQLFQAMVTNRARPVPGIPHTTATINDRRPDPRYYDITQIVNMANAYLDAGQISLTIPGHKGLSLTASYTFGKAIDTGADYTSTGSSDDVIFDAGQTEFDLRRDLKGLSRFDSTHAVLLHFSYDAPGGGGAGALRRSLLAGWNISGAALFKTGTPFTVRIGSDAPGFGNVDGKSSERPHLVDASVLGRAVDHPDTSHQRLPREAFAYLRPGDLVGSLGRATFRKDGIDNVNLAVTKQWTLPSAASERRLLFRVEALNALNHPQFDEPGVSLANPNFGAITNTRNEGRIFQVGLRLVF